MNTLVLYAAGRSLGTRGNRREGHSLELPTAGAIDTERDWPGLWEGRPKYIRGETMCTRDQRAGL
jgi:hypothetical protein